MAENFDFKELLKQAQSIKGEMEKLQEEIAKKTYQGTAGGGMVVATVTGQQALVNIKIDKEVVNPADIDMLQDLIVAAVNQALQKSKETMASELGKLTGGLNIPGL